jgi:hypothetical protein
LNEFDIKDIIETQGGVILRQFAPYDDQYHKSQDEDAVADTHPDDISEKKRPEEGMDFEEKMALRKKTEGYANR